MYTIEKPCDGSFVYALFGVQLPGDNPSTTTESHIVALDSLIIEANCYLDRVTQDGVHVPGKGGKTQVWITTWKTVAQFETWWTTKEVVKFWASLPSDAGVWREFLTVPYSRSQYKATQDRQVGVGVHYSHVPATKNGYWGYIRDSIEEASRENRMDAPLPRPPLPKRPTTPGQFVPGRVHITSFPDNICFALERQDISELTNTEKAIWDEQFDGAVCQWMDDLAFARPEDGILNSRMCYDEKSGVYQTKHAEYHNYKKKLETFYFTDLRAMERIGRFNKGHVALRNNVLKTYGPGGSLFGIGRMALWVETCILKGHEMDAEYVGCADGTGFMAFRDHEAFHAGTGGNH